MFGRSSPRSAKTEIRCKECGTGLEARRSCREVSLYCPKCRTTSGLGQYATRMDAKLEEFLGMIPSDRV